jgi:PAS domain S-box-containing protein
MSDVPGPPTASASLSPAVGLLDSITDAFFWLDHEWRFRYVNDAAEQLLRHTRAELLGEGMFETYPEAVGTEFERQYRRAMRDQVTAAWEAYYPPFERWYQVRAYPSGGGLAVYLQDVTDRKQAEIRLAATEAHYRRLVTTTPHAVYVVDRDGRFSEINPAAERMLGRPASELLGLRAVRVVAAEDRRAVRDVVGRLIKGEADNVTLEAWVRHCSGEERLLALTATAIVEDGQFTGLHGIAKDVTAERSAQRALEESEERLRQIAENVHEIFWVFTPDFSQTLYMSPAYDGIWGAPVAEAYASPRNFLVRIHADDLSAVETAMARVLDENALAVEYRVNRPDGSTRWVTSRGYPVRGADGRVMSVVGTTTDITDRKLAELALLEKQRELLQILDALPVGVSLVDASGDQTWANPALDRIWAGPRPTGPDRYRSFVGYTSGGETRLAHDRWPILRALRGEVVTGEPLDIDAFDGTRKATVVSAVPLRDASGAITGALAVQEDVTERRALEAHQRLLATVFEELREGVCVLTTNGHLLYANRTLVDVLGLDPASIPGFHPSVLAGTSEAAREFPVMLRAALETGRWSGRLEHRRPRDGGVVPVDIVLNRVTGTGGDTLLFAIVQDATEEIEREQQLRRAERLASIGTLVAGVAHELNNPLQAILSFAQLLRLQTQRPEDAEALAVMHREAERMAKVVADLRQVARSTHDRVVQIGPVDLNEVVHHVCRAQAYRLRTGNIDVSEHLAPDLPSVLADRGHLEQVVLNLVVNACQAIGHARRSGRLVLRTAASARGVSLHVVDDGVGIPRAHLERIFDPFFTTKSPGEGTGLGLAVVHSLVTEQGGAIQVESEPGLGTAVHVDWPAASQPAVAPEPEAPSLVGGRPLLRRVLVVDDEPAIRLVLTQFLERRGHVVHAASDGGAALHLLEAGSYDVILSDLRMPGLGGEALLHRLRQRGIGGRLVIMTGDPGSTGALRDDSGVQVLLKPMKLEEVAAVVEKP